MGTRFYSFVNCYLGPRQQGIQTAHVVAKVMGLPYMHLQTKFYLRNSWTLDQTIVVLDGGNCASLLSIKDLFNRDAGEYPWYWYCEDEASLNGAITAVGIIVPDSIWKGPSTSAIATLIQKGKLAV